ncbi:hypothetical protein [Desulfatibacillum aliphaticivorans]|uniref:Outer membrane protein beta-barrel domain-containing protein n=1 Tax=Desulfatibacillum aliphaticivorans TaxID=218208 RepID=B8FMT5_DESAL|nr:hypothetical protein [Desulfatibacillum aliphaticivorans]ACL01952.1 hypothetical protein Dalk_0243 [Desulfatibacillum aliphaticivorans]
MKDSTNAANRKAPVCSNHFNNTKGSYRALLIFIVAAMWVCALCTPALCGQETPAPQVTASPRPAKVPQWSWDWVEDLRETGHAIIPVPVTIDPQSSYQSNPGANSTYRFSMDGAANNDRRSLFSMLDDGEALLGLLDRSGRENSPGFEGMLSDTLNTSFLSMGSRLQFHVSKRFLPYLGGGIIYGGRDSESRVSPSLPAASGYELGVGFSFSDAPVRFGLDFLYRGMDLSEEDPCMTMRKDESCPNNFDKDGYSMSLGFTVHF